KGIQIGTRFIATQESDFEPIWKQAIIDREERQTLVGRGLFGPMRFVRNKRAERIVEQTLEDVPRFYLGEPLDSNEAILKLERDGFDDLIDAKAETALMFGGEVVGRIDDMPTVQSLVNEIISDAAKVIQSLPDQVITK
ncbi:MAG: nitronate monooxygenase, partial [Candidatus Thorarchaeota archaeon]